LIESIGKKCRVLEALIAQLELANCRVECARAETLGQSPSRRGVFHFATARALGPFSVQAELGLPLLTVGGHLLLQKSVKGQVEIEQAQNALELLGGELVEIKRLELPGFLSPRLVAIVRKTSETPAEYPRRPGLPARRPLF
jgi:16S rRNA (guanine527-N7)-methyltransferase